jgi:hypothetical protein
MVQLDLTERPVFKELRVRLVLQVQMALLEAQARQVLRERPVFKELQV